MTINEKQDEIISEFSVFDDWMDKYSYLIDLGSELAAYPETYRTDDNLIDGCQSKVWFHAQYDNGRIVFYADSDAIITKGIASLLVRVLSGQTPYDILHCDLYFVEAIGLQEHLSPTRSNGLMSMIKQIKIYAMAFESVKN